CPLRGPLKLRRHPLAEELRGLLNEGRDRPFLASIERLVAQRFGARGEVLHQLLSLALDGHAGRQYIRPGLLTPSISGSSERIVGPPGKPRRFSTAIARC